MLDNARVFIFLQDIVTSTVSLCLPLDQRIMSVSMAKSHGLYLQALTCFHVSVTHIAKYCLTTMKFIYDVLFSA